MNPEFLGYLKAAPVFLIVISVLVAAHEYGHFLFAKLFKMGVEEFAIGFGKTLWVWRETSTKLPVVVDGDGRAVRDGGEGNASVIEQRTQFALRAWPLGGFVRIKGMAPEEDGSEVYTPGGFFSKAPWKRFIVLAAGPAFSVLAGVLLIFSLELFLGIPKGNNQVLNLIKGSPAQLAGIDLNDRVIRVAGHPVTKQQDIRHYIEASQGRPLEFVVLRKGAEVPITISPKLEDQPSPVVDEDGAPTGEMRRQVRVGILFGQDRVHVGIGQAWATAVNEPVKMVRGLAELISRKQKVEDSVGGPVAILGATKSATEDGVFSVLSLAAALSISVGIMNLLPIYPFDGGQMMVALMEMVRGGRRLSLRVQGAISSIGFACILLLVVSVMFIDIRRVATPDKTKKLELVAPPSK